MKRGVFILSLSFFSIFGFGQSKTNVWKTLGTVESQRKFDENLQFDIEFPDSMLNRHMFQSIAAIRDGIATILEEDS